MYINIYVCIYIYVYVYVYVGINKYIYIYIPLKPRYQAFYPTESVAEAHQPETACTRQPPLASQPLAPWGSLHTYSLDTSKLDHGDITKQSWRHHGNMIDFPIGLWCCDWWVIMGDR